VAVSPALAERLEAVYPGLEIDVINTGVDRVLFRPGAADLSPYGEPPQRPLIVQIGNLIERKNPERLARAAQRLFAERVRLIAGRELPYATLMYIWANRHPIGQVIENPHTQRIRKLVVDSGDAELKRWRSHDRLIYQDFEKVFGERPGRLTKIGILTDTDNTRSTAEALYSDLVITP
jgi:glycosyltransferase involved in cell wall biosynthesis